MSKSSSLAGISKILTIVVSLSLFQFTMAQEFDWALDFPVGSTIPLLEAPDQNGVDQTLDSLAGEKGIVLVFNRSFDWCPFCKAQLVGMLDVSDEFASLGLPMVTITYDPVETLKLVEEDLDVQFKMLHDEAIKHVNAFNIRNMDYMPGDFAYGVPQPGIMIVDTEGVIRFKIAEENFRVRPDWSDVLAAARSF